MSKPLTMTLPDFLKQCRRPIYYKATINKLNNHEVFSLGGLRQYLGKQCFGYGQAYLQKLTQGDYQFVGLWTLPSKASRSDIWVQGRFKLSKNIMRFEEEVTLAHLHLFFKVCRFLNVHWRVERQKMFQAQKAYYKAMEQWRSGALEEYECAHEPDDHPYSPRPSYYEFNSWFFAHHMAPLFYGERMPLSDPLFSLDARDRVVTPPYQALMQKQQIRGL
ncbi:hypothetical protein K0W35_004963 [Vibrio parahaemolyticus]|nr:hypothetical protein [Vibrio parahaemolyticus]